MSTEVSTEWTVYMVRGKYIYLVDDKGNKRRCPNNGFMPVGTRLRNVKFKG